MSPYEENNVPEYKGSFNRRELIVNFSREYEPLEGEENGVIGKRARLTQSDVRNERLKIGMIKEEEMVEIETRSVDEEKVINPMKVDNENQSETLRLKMIPDRKQNSHQQAKVLQFSIHQIIF